MLAFERRAKKEGFTVIIGIDEAGRGPLAGPVVAAAVHLKTFSFKNRIDDSKKLTPQQRARAFDEIMGKACFGVGVIGESVVDSINVSAAANRAVDTAVGRLAWRLRQQGLDLQKTILLLDGRLKSSLPYSAKEIIGGDGRSLSIAAASIIAKVVRDKLMVVYDRLYPQYGFSRHKGYGTAGHFDRIAKFGLSPIHRRTFCRR
ncbi:MAG: ribonuclease HII [Candidatus Omnitrophota bacterium]